MSKIAKRVINIPKGVVVSIEQKEEKMIFFAEGPKGKQQIILPSNIIVNLKKEKNYLTTSGVSQEDIALAGTYNSLLNNILIGVSFGYEKKIEIRGVGYKVERKDSKLAFTLGKSHLIYVSVPKDLDVTVDSGQKGLTVKGLVKQEVNYFSSSLRSLKKPGAYHNKGIYYLNEQKKLKPTKTVSKSGK